MVGFTWANGVDELHSPIAPHNTKNKKTMKHWIIILLTLMACQMGWAQSSADMGHRTKRINGNEEK